MKQTTKNQYYQLLKNHDLKTLELIDSIFYEIDTLLLKNPGRNCKEELLIMIEEIKEIEETLYNKMKEDIKTGALQQ